MLSDEMNEKIVLSNKNLFFSCPRKFIIYRKKKI